MLVEKERCIGCGVCSISCPNGCIKMVEDAEGFRYPFVDVENCTKCCICESNCPILIHKENKLSKTFAMAVKNKNTDIRMKSSSGGVFSSLAENVLKEKGQVCAAKYDIDFSVVHDIFCDIDEIDEYRRAKYSQSRVEESFIDIKNKLDEGIKILFVGTPCQVAALCSYLKKDYENLLTVDMICHGVPSPKIWKKYLEERKKIDAGGCNVRTVNLRDKSAGWSNYTYSVEIVYDNGTVYSVKQDEDNFIKGFISNLYLRPSCSKCIYKEYGRKSDMTLGDYWGIWLQDSEFDDNRGTSALMLNTTKGEKNWKLIENQFDIKKVCVKDIYQYNESAVKSSVAHPRRQEFFQSLNKETSVIKLIKKLLTDSKLQKRNIVQGIWKKIISKV